MTISGHSNHLDFLEQQSIFIIREAYFRLIPLALLWSLGKDSNVLLHLCRKAFLGRVPFDVVHVDTGQKFPEMYDFRDRYSKEWNIRLKVVECPPIEQIDPTLPPAARAGARKAAGLASEIEESGLAGVIAGIRRDEQALRAKERIFSPRWNAHSWDLKRQPPEIWDYYPTYKAASHYRIHPILNWTELDVWLYIRRENIPVVSLYFSSGGSRYRSLGDKDITFPVKSSASTLDEIIAELSDNSVSERSGRAMDHETEGSFEKLRATGYL
ncbi:sulfate adenylyltransferase subunit CysD [Roseomonas mucosa]|uniref:sulfate adenylyltransferase subunit CysD n=1 Tax=Roseomonas mucosa TaxID=207340 RepID=UPI0028CDD7FE|nr:sulfate adenylyltransferase subunit CysD [Roseomonas mucosa]MDT8277833.1 sulfate adenylyltransferase subunit CysD [Roseomonas mucosa]QDD96881.1 Sulfate adenylyltransferase subunit 2 [Roseomonas mucosa]